MPTAEELRIMQAYPIDLKVKKTQLRIREWVNYYGAENCAVSFSGGKDSTVLLHIVRELYPSIEAVFCNTGLEYPEIQKFAKSFDNVTVLTPKMSFKDVITKYGYPFISKELPEQIAFILMQTPQETVNDFTAAVRVQVYKDVYEWLCRNAYSSEERILVQSFYESFIEEEKK